MYKNQRRIKELTPYIPAVDIFRIYEGEPGAAFLDSSLVNEPVSYTHLDVYKRQGYGVYCRAW